MLATRIPCPTSHNAVLSTMILLFLSASHLCQCGAFVAHRCAFNVVSRTDYMFHEPSSSTSLSAAGNNDGSSDYSTVRFLGRGENAIVRPGVVLVAPTHEYNHFLMRSAVFVHARGIDGRTNEHVTRGVIIDHPTAFTMGEMAPGTVVGTLAHNILYRGGDIGNDVALILHSAGGGVDVDLPSYEGEQIGTSGIYEGGLADLMDAVDDGLVDPGRCKFFFNYVEFSDGELESMLGAVDSDGDAWASVEVPPELVLDSDLERGDAWALLRNRIAKVAGDTSTEMEDPEEEGLDYSV